MGYNLKESDYPACLIKDEEGSTREERGIYMVHKSPGAFMVKEYNFFVSQGGLEKKWGMHWFPVIANGVEDARKKGKEIHESLYKFNLENVIKQKP